MKVGAYSGQIANQYLRRALTWASFGIVFGLLAGYLLVIQAAITSLPALVIALGAIVAASICYVNFNSSYKSFKASYAGSQAERDIARVLTRSTQKIVAANVMLPNSHGDIDFVIAHPSLAVVEVKAGGRYSKLSYRADGTIWTAKGTPVAKGKNILGQVTSAANRLAYALSVDSSTVYRIICITNAADGTLDQPWPGTLVCSKDMLSRAVSMLPSNSFVNSAYGLSSLQNLLKNSN